MRDADYTRAKRARDLRVAREIRALVRQQAKADALAAKRERRYARRSIAQLTGLRQPVN